VDVNAPAGWSAERTSSSEKPSPGFTFVGEEKYDCIDDAGMLR
jgi:hypothetical protein